MSDDSSSVDIEESIEESFDAFEDESLAQGTSKSHMTSKAEGKEDESSAGSDKTYQDTFIEESLTQTKGSLGSTSHAQVGTGGLQQTKSDLGSANHASPRASGTTPNASSAPGSKVGSKEALPGEPKAEESNAEEATSNAKVPRPWTSAGGLSSATDHLMRSNDARLFSLRHPFTERTIIVREPSPTFASARKIPRGLLKKMEEETKRKENAEAEDGSSATSAVGSSQQPSSPKAKRKHLLYTMPQRSSNAVWGEINKEFKPFMRVKAEYTTPAGRKVTAFGQLLSGWEVPKSRLREGPHARPPKGLQPPTAKAVTTLPLVEKERSEKFVRVMLHDGVERLLPRNKVKNADPADIFR